MRRIATHASLLLLLAVALVGARAAVASPRVEPHARYASPAARAPQVLSDRSIARLSAEGRSVLWVFFTDKTERDAASFARCSE